jgi:hypothetical protein
VREEEARGGVMVGLIMSLEGRVKEGGACECCATAE